MGARGAFEFFATLQMSGPPHESAAKKSSDETPTAPQPARHTGPLPNSADIQSTIAGGPVTRTTPPQVMHATGPNRKPK